MNYMDFDENDIRHWEPAVALYTKKYVTRFHNGRGILDDRTIINNQSETIEDVKQQLRIAVWKGITDYNKKPIPFQLSTIVFRQLNQMLDVMGRHSFAKKRGESLISCNEKMLNHVHNILYGQGISDE